MIAAFPFSCQLFIVSEGLLLGFLSFISFVYTMIVLSTKYAITTVVTTNQSVTKEGQCE